MLSFFPFFLGYTRDEVVFFTCYMRKHILSGGPTMNGLRLITAKVT